MKTGILASKKNVIILSVIALSIILMLTSYYTKRARIQKQTALGGHIELISQGVLFTNPVSNFVNSHSTKNSYVVDLKTKLTLSSGAFESNVRIFDWKYPLMGVLQVDNSKFSDVFNMAQKKRTEKVMETPEPVVAAKGSKAAKAAKAAKPVEKIVEIVETTFGVAVNQVFLDKTGMKIGETFKMNANSYQLRGLIKSFPDDGGQKLMSEPLLILKHFQVPGGLMYPLASRRTYHLFINKMAKNSEWQENFKRSVPNAQVIIKRWDS